MQRFFAIGGHGNELAFLFDLNRGRTCFYLGLTVGLHVLDDGLDRRKAGKPGKIEKSG